MNMNKPEILAPAGGPDALDAALRCGANAVYIGATSFSARGSAENFDTHALREAAASCHLNGARLYLALNTLLFDRELPAAAALIAQAADAGVDAIIVQDLGVAALVKKICPSMPLHGSTQMSVHTLSGALFLQKQGFSRVILARELSHDELREIAAACTIQTEVFVHGALCMSVSGQCYLSAVAGRRSGNRGQCAQPCRLPFTANRGDTACGLSLKDLSIVTEIPTLAAMGVSSVKIEGRLKRPEYVAAAVSACVSSRDGTLQNGQLSQLQAVFSRSGFTAGYYEATRGKGMFGTREKEDVTAAQGVLKDLARLYDRQTPRVEVDFIYTQKAGQPVSLTAVDEDGNRVVALGEIPAVAINSPTDTARARGAIEKLGGTPFYARDISFDIDETLMVPNAWINALRRDCCEQLTALRTRPKQREVLPLESPVRLPTHNASPLPALRARFRRFDQLPPDRLDALELIYLPVGEILSHTEQLAPVRDKLVACPPRGMFGQEQTVLAQLAQVKTLGIDKLYAPGLGAIELGQRLGMELFGGYSLNATNSVALEELRLLGLRDTELSFELDLTQARALQGALPRGILAYGRLPLMLVRCCPLNHTRTCKDCRTRGGYMFDRLNNRFWVACEGAASEIYNCRTLFLADRLSELRGVDFITLLFTDEAADEALGVIDCYQTGGAPPEEFTRGLYYRGVL